MTTQLRIMFFAYEKQHLSEQNIFPLKVMSFFRGADDPGMHKTFEAKLAGDGYLES